MADASRPDASRLLASRAAVRRAALRRAVDRLTAAEGPPGVSRFSGGHPAAAQRLSGLAVALRRLAMLVLVVLLSFTLAACDGSGNRAAPTIGPQDMAMITKQAEGFLAARDRLPELATLVNRRDWTFTRNLIHGPMQEVGRQMLYINQRLLPSDRAEASARADKLKASLAELDEAARLQDSESLRKAYISVASSFGRYAQVLPEEVKVALKQV